MGCCVSSGFQNDYIPEGNPLTPRSIGLRSSVRIHVRQLQQEKNLNFVNVISMCYRTARPALERKGIT